jgi:hypothetical protein
MSEQVDFALRPGVQPGDSAFFLNPGRHQLAFDPFPGRAIAVAFLGSVADPVAEAALSAPSATGALSTMTRPPSSRSLANPVLDRRSRWKPDFPRSFSCGRATEWRAQQTKLEELESRLDLFERTIENDRQKLESDKPAPEKKP